jgi:hypothetical protein
MSKKPVRRRGRDYEVGRCRPPKHTQWQPGQSGNPKGRPKGSRNLLAIFHEALQQRILIEERGKKRSITAREGIVKRLVNSALKGDPKATAFFLAKDSEISQYVSPSTKEKITKNMSAEEAAKTYLRLVRQVVG